LYQDLEFHPPNQKTRYYHNTLLIDECDLEKTILVMVGFPIYVILQGVNMYTTYKKYTTLL